jgi:hypothetical protein
MRKETADSSSYNVCADSRSHWQQPKKESSSILESSVKGAVRSFSKRLLGSAEATLPHPTRPDPSRIVLLAKPPCVSVEEAVCAKISVCSRRSFRRFIQFARPFLYTSHHPWIAHGIFKIFLSSPHPALPPALKCLCCIFLHVSLPCFHCACSSVLWCFSRFVVAKEPSATALCITSFSRDFHFSHVKVSRNSIVLNRVLACCSGKEGRVSWSSWIRRESGSSKISPSAH